MLFHIDRWVKIFKIILNESLSVFETCFPQNVTPFDFQVFLDIRKYFLNDFGMF